MEPEGKCRSGKKQLRLDEAKQWVNVALADATEGKSDAIAAALSLLLGLRASEIISLEVPDVDDQGRLVWVADSKTEAGKRTLTVPFSLQPYLIGLCKNRNPHDRLFGHHWRAWPRDWVQRICKKAGVPLMRGLHSTLALQAGITPQVVASSLGHESASTTLQHYAAPGSLQAQRQAHVVHHLEKGGPQSHTFC